MGKSTDVFHGSPMRDSAESVSPPPADGEVSHIAGCDCEDCAKYRAQQRSADDPNFDEVLAKVLALPTLVEALSFVATFENERAVAQALRRPSYVVSSHRVGLPSGHGLPPSLSMVVNERKRAEKAEAELARIRERSNPYTSCPDGTDADEPSDRGFVCVHQADAEALHDNQDKYRTLGRMVRAVLLSATPMIASSLETVDGTAMKDLRTAWAALDSSSLEPEPVHAGEGERLMGTKVVHLGLDIAGALEWSNERLTGLLVDGARRLPGGEVREHLQAAWDRGDRMLPIGDECVGFSYLTGCPGHREDS